MSTVPQLRPGPTQQFVETKREEMSLQRKILPFTLAIRSALIAWWFYLGHLAATSKEAAVCTDPWPKWFYVQGGVSVALTFLMISNLYALSELFKNDDAARSAFYFKKGRNEEGQAARSKAHAEHGVLQVSRLAQVAGCCTVLVCLFDIGWLAWGVKMYVWSEKACKTESFFKYYFYAVAVNLAISFLRSALVFTGLKRKCIAREPEVATVSYQPLP